MLNIALLTVATVGELGELWRTPVHPGTRLKEPASLAGSVYVPGFSGQLARVNAATGAVVWRRTLDAGAAPEPSELSSPVLFGDALRVSWSCCRAGVAGTFWVDPKTGADVPMPPGGAAGYAQPAVARGKLAGFMTVGGGVYHLNWGDIGVTAASGDDGGQVGFDFAIAGGLIHWPYGRWAQAFSGCHPQDDEYHPCAPDWRTDLGAVPGPPAAIGAIRELHGALDDYLRELASSFGPAVTIIAATAGRGSSDSSTHSLSVGPWMNSVTR